jgi:predicted cupin superfamily sugar epimerase
MVSPGFDFEDFELFNQEQLLMNYPQHEEIIRKMAYK